MGSPPQIETMGAPHSSAAWRHCSTESFSLMVSAYSRIRPQPVHVRLQACRGSSIITSGNFSTPRSLLPAMYLDMLAVIVSGNLTTSSLIDDIEQVRTSESNAGTDGISDKRPSENPFR